MSKVTKVVFPTDEHHPFANYKAINLALQITADFNPDIRITGSDGVDFYSLSSFDKNPERIHTLQDELDSWASTQRSWLDAAPNARNYFIVGNHEDRLRRFIWKNQELSGLRGLNLSNLFEFDQLGITLAPRDGLELIIKKKLIITHGSVVRNYSAYTARAELEAKRYNMNVMTGHTHRGGRFLTTTPGGIVEAVECFCLCSLAPEYKSYPDWQQGLVLAEVGEIVSIEMIPFHQIKGDMVARWRGKEYRS